MPRTNSENMFLNSFVSFSNIYHYKDVVYYQLYPYHSLRTSVLYVNAFFDLEILVPCLYFTKTKTYYYMSYIFSPIFHSQSKQI